MCIKKILCLLLIILFASCNDDDNPIIDSNSEISEESFPFDSSELIGSWHYFDGDITRIIGDSQKDSLIIDQILSFNSARNFTENESFYLPGYYIEYEDTTALGNYILNDKKIIIQDWEGTKTNKEITIKFLKQDSLVISIDNHICIYRKIGTEFTHLQKEILGYWYSLKKEKYRPFYEFKDDGFFRIRVYYKDIPAEGKRKWRIENYGSFISGHYPVENEEHECKMIFLNRKFIRWLDSGGYITQARKEYPE